MSEPNQDNYFELPLDKPIRMETLDGLSTDEHGRL